MKDADKVSSFSCKTEGGVTVSFYQTRREIDTRVPEFVLEVRGPGQEGQHEFVGRIKIEVRAHGHMEQFRRWLVLTADHSKPLELINHHSRFETFGASFYPPERIAYEVRMGNGSGEGCKLLLPCNALKELRLEMLQTKPPGDVDY